MSYRIRSENRTKSIELGEAVNAGGATGKVYRINKNPKLCAKIYHDPAYASKARPKIMAMLEATPSLNPISLNRKAYHQIAWPQGVVENDEGAFVGFTMPFLTSGRTVPLNRLITKAGRQQEKLPESYETRLLVARNMAAIVAAVHAAGHAIVDLKPINFRLYRDAPFICLIDTDGLRIQGRGSEMFQAEHLSDEYRAPESGTKTPDDLGVPQDLFALATLVFQLLNNGIHPFQGIPANDSVPTTTQERIDAGLYAYGLTPTLLSPHPQSAHDLFDSDTNFLFARAFTTTVRPSAAEWLAHLTDLARPPRIRRCVVNPDHLAFARGCPSCRVDEVLEANKRQAAAASAALIRKTQSATTSTTTTVVRPPPPAPPSPKGFWTWRRAAVAAFCAWFAWQWLDSRPRIPSSTTAPSTLPSASVQSPAKPPALAPAGAFGSLGVVPPGSAEAGRKGPEPLECRDPRTGQTYTLSTDGGRCFDGDLPEAEYAARKRKRDAVLSSAQALMPSKAPVRSPSTVHQHLIAGEWKQEKVQVNDALTLCMTGGAFDKSTGPGVTGIVAAFASPQDALLALGMPDDKPIWGEQAVNRIVTVSIDDAQHFQGRARNVANFGLAIGRIGASEIEALKAGLNMLIVVDGMEPGLRVQLKGSGRALGRAQECAKTVPNY